MNPFRIWALISQGVLRVIERFFSGLPTKGSLMSHVQTHLGPTETIRQDELTVLTEIVQRGSASAKVLERGGVMTTERIPPIPALSHVGEQSYKSIVVVRIGEEIKRFPVTVHTDHPITEADLKLENKRVIEQLIADAISPEFLEWLINKRNYEIETTNIISVYRNVGLNEWTPFTE